MGAVRVLSADWVLPVEGEPIENGAVVIRDGRIEAVGRSAELGRGEHHAGAAIVPGFINAHTHLEYAVYAGFGDGLSFAPWLATHIERKSRIGREEMEAIARLGAAECLASGVTTVADASFVGAAAHACSALGLRAIVYLEVFGRDPDEALTRYREKLEYVGPALSERVSVGVSPHAPYTCATEVYAACMSLDVPVMTHLNESMDELEWLLRGEGPMTPVSDLLVDPDGRTGIRRLAEAGILDERIVAAHCVKVDAEEIELLAHSDVAVAHCPRSNALLGCGVAPLAELRAAGLRVGVGTDGVSSVPSHDYFEELRRSSPRHAPAPNVPTPCLRPRRSSLPRSAVRARSASTPRPGRSAPASAPIWRWSRFPALPIYHGRIRRRQSCTAAVPAASSLLSSTASTDTSSKPETRKEGSNGTS